MLTCGATAVTMLVRGRKLYVTWLGDSQVAMCKGGEMVKLMDPHKPEVIDAVVMQAQPSSLVVAPWLLLKDYQQQSLQYTCVMPSTLRPLLSCHIHAPCSARTRSSGLQTPKASWCGMVLGG
eukprot:TRINITY_DN9680_c0_g2_i1.p2 TRINITY_DN9680_c0_g2~~TRINITY_DN9680_c0_g2_i1.p2  ORF type:complete len:122 (+),score=4.44 TRINITY_DN9680_c0_g2_i1:117-482(+)